LNYFEGNKVSLTLEESDWIANNLPIQGKLSTKLLFRANRDGWNPEAFHGLCDDQGPTVLLYKFAKTNRRAAGYASVSWASRGNYSGSNYRHTQDDNAILFSIDKRITSKAIAGTQYLLNCASCGPCMGATFSG
jgi:TLD